MITGILAGSAMKKLPWKKIVVGLVILLIIYIIYRQGKKSGELGKVKNTDIPIDVYNGGNVLVDGAKIREMSTLLHDDMKGVNVFWNDDLFQNLAKLSDSELVALDNDFNERYYNEGEGTFKEWINSQQFWWYSGSLAELVNEVILPRMAGLNLN